MTALNNLKISRKLTLSFLLMVVISIAVNGISWFELSTLKKNDSWTIHTYNVMSTLDAATDGLAEQQSLMRGYLLSGNPQLLELYAQAQKSYRQNFDQVRTMTIDNPVQQKRLDELDALAIAWHVDYAEPQIALTKKGPEGLEQARTLAATTSIGRIKMDGIREKTGQIRLAESSLLETRSTAAEQAYDSMVWSIIIGSLVGVLTATLLGALLSKVIARPITLMTTSMADLASGDTQRDIPAQQRQDEIGQMAKAVQVFKDNMIQTARLTIQQDEKRQQDELRAAKLVQLTGGFDGAVKTSLSSVGSAASQLQATAGSLTDTAERTSHQASAVASAAEEAASNVQTVASAAEELSSSIAEISRQVSQSAQIAGNAVHEADRTNVIVQGLAEAAGRIGDVVNLINDIASQTNLLALNATIEAARAGDAGKGFAVVAGEVKNLANQTAKATDEISSQIAAVQNATREAVDAIRGVGSTIGQINEIATAIASAVEEQGAATQEIARNVQQAAIGTQQVTANITGVNSSAETAGNAAHDVLGASTALSREATSLSGLVEAFLREVRVA